MSHADDGRHDAPRRIAHEHVHAASIMLEAALDAVDGGMWGNASVLLHASAERMIRAQRVCDAEQMRLAGLSQVA